jgi:hypothetical protein
VVTRTRCVYFLFILSEPYYTLAASDDNQPISNGARFQPPVQLSSGTDHDIGISVPLHQTIYCRRVNCIFFLGVDEGENIAVTRLYSNFERSASLPLVKVFIGHVKVKLAWW